MSQSRRESRNGGGSQTSLGGGGESWTRWGTLVAVVAVGAITLANGQFARRSSEAVEGRLAKLDSRLDQMARKVDEVATNAAKAGRQAPDPNRVYTFKTEGSPVRGASNAAVTIVEVSDFQ